MAMLMTTDQVPSKKPKLTTYVGEKVDRLIEQEARKESRSKSQMIAVLVKQALAARGYTVEEIEGDDSNVDD